MPTEHILYITNMVNGEFLLNMQSFLTLGGSDDDAFLAMIRCKKKRAFTLLALDRATTVIQSSASSATDKTRMLQLFTGMLEKIDLLKKEKKLKLRNEIIQQNITSGKQQHAKKRAKLEKEASDAKEKERLSKEQKKEEKRLKKEEKRLEREEIEKEDKRLKDIEEASKKEKRKRTKVFFGDFDTNDSAQHANEIQKEIEQLNIKNKSAQDEAKRTRERKARQKEKEEKEERKKERKILKKKKKEEDREKEKEETERKIKDDDHKLIASSTKRADAKIERDEKKKSEKQEEKLKSYPPDKKKYNQLLSQVLSYFLKILYRYFFSFFSHIETGSH